MVVREVGFIRRNVGQVMIAAAIIDDTIGWVIVSIVLGLARDRARSTSSRAPRQPRWVTAVFLVRQLHHRAASRLSDHPLGQRPIFVSDFAVVTAILVVTAHRWPCSPRAIGVHTVLGAFIAGILVGQSPILTRHIDEQLRGLIAALFMPVFFGMAGLTANLAVLGQHQPAVCSQVGLIAIASLRQIQRRLPRRPSWAE